MPDKTYPEGKTYKQRGCYTSGGWCPNRYSDDLGTCIGNCDKCIIIQGKKTELRRKNE
jgi:hypothetical protein